MVSISVLSKDVEAHRKQIGEILGTASEQAGHSFAPTVLDLTANIDGVEVGGLSGQLIYGWLWIMLLGVGTAHRGRGVGQALIEEAEAFARAHGAIGMNVDTFAYQAPGFYERLGFTEVSRLSGPVPAEDRIYFVKRLSSGEPR